MNLFIEVDLYLVSIGDEYPLFSLQYEEAMAKFVLPKLDVDLRGEVSMKKTAPQAHCHPREIGFMCPAPLLPRRPSGGPGQPRQALREARSKLALEKK